MEENRRVILAGDIGGTHTRLALFQMEGEGLLQSLVEETFPSGEFAGLDQIVSQFLSAHNLPVERACFGVAGPIKHNRCEATNLHWVVDARQLTAELGIKLVRLINDLEANAYGLAVLQTKDFVVLNQGVSDARATPPLLRRARGLEKLGFTGTARSTCLSLVKAATPISRRAAISKPIYFV